MAAKKQQNRVNSDRTERQQAPESPRVPALQSAAGGGSRADRERFRSGTGSGAGGAGPCGSDRPGSFAWPSFYFLSNFHLCGFAGDF